MIGVVSKAGQAGTVEEFFQLFKTPWEFYCPGRAYDAVVATAEDVPEVAAKLLVLYGAERKGRDAADGVSFDARRQGAPVNYRGTVLPIYGDLATFQNTGAGTPFLATENQTVGLVKRTGDSTVMRVGYDLFEEVAWLLSEGQPTENAHIPALDVHISMLREWIVDAGIALLEIPPAPAGYSCFICLTHDIDFVGIRNHAFDHTMAGFLYRSTFGALRNFLRGRISLARFLRSWRAAASLPLVYLGWVKDFWNPFEWYLRVEKNLHATYFLIPFKKRPGDRVPARHASRRAAAYDVGELAQWTTTLRNQGCELGVHGIDAWHSVERGREELARIAEIAGQTPAGIRVHWLLRDANTFRVLEQAGYGYDSTVGYNETVGYRSGTTQAFCPPGGHALLELPMHIQDGALFLSQRLDLSEPEAWKRCEPLLDHARNSGGALTVLWHDRSHGPERFWGDFYLRLIEALRSLDGWFGTAGQTVEWFRKRRAARFEQIEDADGATRMLLRYEGEPIEPPLRIRVYRPHGETNDRKPFREPALDWRDVAWNGRPGEEITRLLDEVSAASAKAAGAAIATGNANRQGPNRQPARSLL